MRLLEEIKVGNLKLKNRIMFPPLTTGYEERDGSIGERSFHFYERLAKGGTGYIVIGDVAPVNTASPTPKLCDDRQIPGFRKLADALHAYDCKLGLQIFHPEYDVPGVGKKIMGSRMAAMAGQQAKEAGDMETFVAKMAEAKKLSDEAYAKLRHDMQHFITEATTEQLNEIKEAIAQCARRAMEAGADAVEIHGDRLLGSLCSPLLNHRTDEYGGTFENRIRYALEVVAAIKEAAPTVMVEYKLPIITKNADGSNRGKGGVFEDEGVAFAKYLEDAGVDMIQVAQANHTGNMGDTIPPMGTADYNWTLPIAKRVKETVRIPVATVGRVVTVENGEQILENNEADIVGYGRSLLCDPDIALKAAKGEPIRECLNCNKGCVDAIQSRRYISCVLNAENGDEETIFIRPAEVRKNIIVIGAGIAGLEAARVAAVRGHHVDLYEKEDHIGGQINIAGVPPRKSEILRSVEYYEKILPQLDITLHLNSECTKDAMNAADAVICAVGAHDLLLPIPGADSENVLSSWDILSGKVKGKIEGKEHCAVIGGGLVGTETAEYLLTNGCQVSVIEMLDKIAAGESETILPHINENFKKYGAKEYVNTKVLRIEEDGTKITALNTKDNEEIVIHCDRVVMAVGSVKNDFDAEGVTTEIIYAGDCAGEKTAGIAEAVRAGYDAGNRV